MSAEPEPEAAGPKRPGMRRAAAGTYLSYLGVSFLGLLNVLIVARDLGPTGRGDVTFLMTVAGITGYVLNMSVHESNANFSGLKSHRIPSLGTNSVVLSLLLGLAAAGVAVAALAYAPFLKQDVPAGNLALALVSIPAVMLQTYLVYLARGSYQFTVANIAMLTAPTVALTANVVMMITGTLSVTTALAAWSAGNTLAALFLAVHHGLTAGYTRPDRRLAQEAVTFGAKSHIGGVLATGNYRMDQWILGAVAGSRELGLYSIAVAWFEGLFLLPMAVSAVARPDLVRAKGAEAGARIASLFRLTVALTLIAAVALFLLAPVLCTGIFGDSFSGSVEPLRLLAVGALGISAAKLIGIGLIAQQRPLLESASMGTGFVVALVLYVILIPSYGANGAAIASTIAYTAAGLAAAAFLVRQFDVRPSALIPRPSDARQLADLVGAAGRNISGSLRRG